MNRMQWACLLQQVSEQSAAAIAGGGGGGGGCGSGKAKAATQHKERPFSRDALKTLV